MTELLLAALIACSTGDATCAAHDAGAHTVVYICDVAPSQAGQKRIPVNLDERLHVITIAARCESA